MVADIGQAVARFSGRFDQYLILFLAELRCQKPCCAIVFSNKSFLFQCINDSLVGRYTGFIGRVKSMFIKIRVMTYAEPFESLFYLGEYDGLSAVFKGHHVAAFS